MMKKVAKVLCFMTAAFFAGQCFSAMSGVGDLDSSGMLASGITGGRPRELTEGAGMI